MVDLSQLLFPLLLSVLAVGPIVVLVRYYQLIKNRDFLYFSIAFIMIIVQLLIFGISGVDELSIYNPSHGISAKQFELTQQLLVISGIVSWYFMFLIGKRSRWENKRVWIHWVMSVWFTVLVVLTFFTRLQNNPNSTTLWGIQMYSTIEGGKQLVMIDLGFGLLFGQGYRILDITFRMSCAIIFAYSMIRLENTFAYPKFSFVRTVWLTLAVSYILSQIMNLIPIFFTSFNSAVVTISFSVFQIIGGFCFLIIALYTPEGFLLSKVQVVRVFKTYEDYHLLEEMHKPKNFLSVKLLDYIKHVEAKVTQPPEGEEKEGSR